MTANQPNKPDSGKPARDEIVERLAFVIGGYVSAADRAYKEHYDCANRLMPIVESLLAEAENLGRRQALMLELSCGHLVPNTSDPMPGESGIKMPDCPVCSAEQRASAGMQAAAIDAWAQDAQALMSEIGNAYGFFEDGFLADAIQSLKNAEKCLEGCRNRLANLTQADGTNALEREQAKARLEEGKWWHVLVALVDESRSLLDETRQRRAELERAAGEREGGKG